MTTAEERGWGSPDAPGYQKNHIVRVTAGGVKVNVRKEIQFLVGGFLNECLHRGYRFDKIADDWGYVNRDIRGRPGVKSNHAWGLAIDVNSTSNPMTEDGIKHTDMPSWMPEVARIWGFYWGGLYTGKRKDPMHYEYLGTPADVKRYPLARKGK